MERWKPVVGYEALYQVSSLGNVRRIAGWIDRARTPKSGNIACDMNQDGYKRVVFSSGSSKTKKRFQLHRVVYEAFVGSIPGGFQVNHLNGDRSDNTPENLQAVTSSENIKHSFRLLGRRPVQGSLRCTAKLNEDQVVEIRARRAAGEKLKPIAESYGVSQQTISEVANRRHWTHV